MNNRSLGFTFISGGGWLLDLAIMTLLIQISIEPGISNFISATTAATFVYWIGRKFLFKKQFGLAATGGYLFYLLYTAIIVLFFSFLIQYSTVSAHEYLISIGYSFELLIIALAVKIFYTPFNLALNYSVSCILAKRF